MSDELKKRHGKWLNWGSAAVFTVAMTAAYQGAHYATAEVVHYSGACSGHCTHTIGGIEAPEWVDRYSSGPRIGSTN
jgi:hypothetical protein